ncbi:hypothetical protein LOTGIDRAFT_229639 [Lottia gigantea]|uniref:Uncharacterized protein n=1 Tax=Lottia gigantea TaxID=225164 RepID=V4B6J2_LOTGI|nr:hypothetical protein LOTGIDRAFT_229639 [Lottia gigantea]ESO84169.1 hypothetical protein LOTGIDRAFT_229639 [Lottia gigantea]
MANGGLDTMSLCEQKSALQDLTMSQPSFGIRLVNKYIPFVMKFIILLALLPIFTGAVQKCCTDKQFTAILGEPNQIVKGNFQFTTLAEDFTSKLIATETYSFSPGNSSTKLVRVVQDFNQKKMFVIFDSTSTCTAKDLTYDMPSNCVPDDAEFIGQSYMGFAPNQVNISAFKWKFAGTADLLIMFNDNCVPVVESISGVVGSDPVDKTYTFTNYNTGISDRSVFNIPAYCTQ